MTSHGNTTRVKVARLREREAYRDMTESFAAGRAKNAVSGWASFAHKFASLNACHESIPAIKPSPQ